MRLLQEVQEYARQHGIRRLGFEFIRLAVIIVGILAGVLLAKLEEYLGIQLLRDPPTN